MRRKAGMGCLSIQIDFHHQTMLEKSAVQYHLHLDSSPKDSHKENTKENQNCEYFQN